MRLPDHTNMLHSLHNRRVGSAGCSASFVGKGSHMHAARLKRIGPLKVVVAGALLAVAVLAALLLALVAAQKPAEAAFPGKNGKIAFVGDGGIWTMNQDGSDKTRLTDSGSDYLPAWSPDGTKIAFHRNQTGMSEIWTMNADGSNQTNITNTIHSSNDGSPAWSPDGTKIAFSSCCRGHDFAEIYIMDADGSDPTRLTYDTGEHDAWGNSWASSVMPAWSPDGTKIAYMRLIQTIHYDFYPQIYIMDADGSNPTNLSERHFGDYGDEESNPVWSPDGTQIAFNSKKTGNPEIYVMNIDGSNMTQLTYEASHEWTRTNGCEDSWDYFNANPAWSPDGTKIAFESNRCVGNRGIYTMNADGSNQTFLTAGAWPDWQPLPGPTLPTSKVQCKHGGYKDFGFKNQGRCIAYVQRAADSR